MDLEFENETSHANYAHALDLQEWKNISTERPLRIMVAGLGGVGKSTLVNRLFGLGEKESVAEEGCRGEATTEVVRRYHHKLKNGVVAIIFDTPGFDDPDMNEHRIIADMKLKTEAKLDVILYCISMERKSPRITEGDIRTISLLTKVFGASIWKNAIIVMTFANQACKNMRKEQYLQLREKIKEKLYDYLHEKAHVPRDIALGLPVVTAGHTDLEIPHEECENWKDRLFWEIIKRINPEVVTTLLKGKFMKEDFLKILGGGAGGGFVGVGVGASVGAGIGAAFGIIGGPFGIAIGAGVGAAGGGVIGGTSGATGVSAMIVRNIERIKDRLKVTRQERKIKQERRKSLHREHNHL